jgi:hypothetical protein
MPDEDDVGRDPEIAVLEADICHKRMELAELEEALFRLLDKDFGPEAP